MTLQSSLKPRMLQIVPVFKVAMMIMCFCTSQTINSKVGQFYYYDYIT